MVVDNKDMLQQMIVLPILDVMDWDIYTQIVEFVMELLQQQIQNAFHGKPLLYVINAETIKLIILIVHANRELIH